MSLPARIQTFVDEVLFEGKYEREIGWIGGAFVGLVLLLVAADMLR